MQRIIIIVASIMAVIAIEAQETYESARLASDDLNGTARYVGMGGAMEALGADMSTMGSNPAGIGLFRKSVTSMSFGVVSQADATSFRNANKTNMSFDQIGFVYAMRSGNNSYVNVGFNYHKSKNFDYILSVSDNLNGASQNKLSYLKGYTGVFDIEKSNGTYYSNSSTFNQLDYLYYNTLLADDDDVFYYNEASDYALKRGNSGYIGEYDFNLSGNYNDNFYWGVTFGIKDVNYKGVSSYTENLVYSDGETAGTVIVDDIRKITGTGFDVKFGIIFRPVEYSPFRIGLYVHTPTWYDLTTKNYTLLTNNAYSTGSGSASSCDIGEVYDFKFYTPWKFGISLGHTISDYLALGLTYEYADYGTSDIRVNDGGYYDGYWGDYYENSYSDGLMNDNIEETLRAVSTLKLGMEFKPSSDFAVRLGYNYVSPMYDKNGYKDGTISSAGTYYSSSTDYTNWKSTNRVTAGIGYTYDKWNFDMTYMYSCTNGEFSPFMSYYPSDDESELANQPGCVDVSNKRNQVLFTIGYKF